ncbi:hydrophobic surface binding protein A-domain-containing protein [Aspergillus cavernicola]|uniref:Hydrophobic surface binding protein A-domain-containing protein n=1 Tax=Aspergillus cavernicola TaxID=176166 RepID=A0ABR4IZ43_9EURO
MKFTGLFTVALATTALATPAKRQSSVTDLIDNIAQQVAALSDAVSSFDGGDPSDVQSASDTLVETITSAAEQVNSGDDLSNADALALTSPVQDLTDDVDGVVDQLISKQDQFVSAGAGGAVKTSLDDQYDAASSLADAISSKVPTALESIAAELSAGITAAIQRGVDAYADVEDDGGATTTDTATSTATSTATETETETETTATETETETETSTSTSSVPVIPTGSSTTTPTESSTPTASETPADPEFTGAATKERLSLVGALAAVAVAIAV